MTSTTRASAPAAHTGTSKKEISMSAIHSGNTCCKAQHCNVAGALPRSQETDKKATHVAKERHDATSIAGDSSHSQGLWRQEVIHPDNKRCTAQPCMSHNATKSEMAEQAANACRMMRRSLRWRNGLQQPREDPCIRDNLQDGSVCRDATA